MQQNEFSFKSSIYLSEGIKLVVDRSWSYREK